MRLRARARRRVAPLAATLLAATLLAVLASLAASAPPVAVVARAGCVKAGEAMLRGVVRREIQLGAPGYGENPATDRRDTIAVLVVPRPLTLCRDSALHDAHDPPVRTRRVALRTVPREILLLRGESVVVFGRLDEAEFAWEYGPLVMRVDSVPALRKAPGAKST